MSRRNRGEKKVTWENWLKEQVNYFSPYGNTYTNPLYNDANFNYLGELYMGSNKQRFSVVWDTGSGGLFLETSDCWNCYGDTLEISESSTFSWVEPYELKTIEYMDGTSLEGYLAYDKACATGREEGSCV